MWLFGLRRADITIHGISGGQFSPLWHRLILPFEGVPATHFRPFHLAPAAFGNPAPTGDGHSVLTLPAPIDAATPIPGDQDSGGSGSAGNGTYGIPAPQLGDAASPLDDQAPGRHPPFFAPAPISEARFDGASTPGDSAPPAGHIPKSEALIWSGPAIVVFPAEAHETSGDAAAPDGGDTASSDVADTPDVLTRADLDPVLAAMGSGADHPASSDAGAGDLSAAFLPPGSDDLADLPHGLDLGFAFTPPPLPPPPDMI